MKLCRLRDLKCLLSLTSPSSLPSLRFVSTAVAAGVVVVIVVVVAVVSA